MTIFKYVLSLTDIQSINMPKFAKVLSVQMKDGKICLWVLVNPNEKVIPYTVRIVGTGNPAYVADFSYYGTVQQNMLQKTFVWHVFGTIEMIN